LKIDRDAFLQTVVGPTHLIPPNDHLFTSTHIKIVATEETVRVYCSGDDISACAYVPCEKPEPGTYYFARAALEAFATKLTTEAVVIERDGARNILRADQRTMEFLDPKNNHSFPRKPQSKLENLDTLSESDALMIQTIAQAASTSTKLSPEYHCVYASPIEAGTEIFAYNGSALAMGVLDKKFKQAVALPVQLARMAKFGNLLVSDTEVGIEGPYCLYWCKAPVKSQKQFPLDKCHNALNKTGEHLFDIDGKDMSAAVDLLQRAFASWDEASDASLVLTGNTLKVCVRFPSTLFEEVLTVRGSGVDTVLKLPLQEHARLLPALARQPVLSVYNVGKHVRFEGDGFKLLLPIDYSA
jgi:hypothetical protein